MHFDTNSPRKAGDSLGGKNKFPWFPNIKKSYSQLSLGGKISIPFVSVFLGVWLFGTVSLGIYVSRSLEQRTRYQTNEVANLVLREFQQQRQKLRFNAKLLAEQIEIREAVDNGDSSEILRELISFQTSLAINFIEVFDRQGNIIIDLKSQETKNLHLNPQDLRLKVLKGLSFRSILTSDRSSPALLVGVSPISNRQETIGGIIVGTMVNDALLKQIVSRTDKHLIAFTKDNFIASTFNQYNPPENKMTLPGQSIIQIRDRPYLTHTATLSGLEDADFQLMVLSPLDSLQRDRQKLWLGIGLISLLGGGIAIVTGFCIAGKIVRRIGDLTKATKELAQGNLTQKLPTNPSDEIGQLAMNFNAMVGELVFREERLNEHMQELEKTLEKLRTMQAQLVQNEKISSLGQMVAGIAHEINNPVTFIHGNLSYAAQYTQDLLTLTNMYGRLYPQPVPEIHEYLEQIDLEFVATDLPKLLASMQIGTNRIREIVLSLRNFSRLDEAELKEVEIHQGIESTLSIVRHRFKDRGEKPEIRVVPEYNCYPLELKCYAGKLNQVFLNLLVNAIDALEEVTQNPQITIRSCVEGESVKIAIADNGKGIPEEIQGKIFDPFFTTKPVGQGTGLGLAIVYQIIEQHQGKIKCFSQVDQGTEFIIELPI